MSDAQSRTTDTEEQTPEDGPEPGERSTDEYDEMLAGEIDDYETLRELLEEDPSRAYDEKVKLALAQAKLRDDDLWSRFTGGLLGDLDGVDYNDYRYTKIPNKVEELTQEQQDEDQERGPPEIGEPETPVYWDDVEEVILENYDQHVLDVIEALCANALVLTFKYVDNAPMMFAEGASGAAKTTAISTMEGTTDGLLIRADQITPAAFNSHSTEQENEGENDLIPEIRHRVLSVRELSKLFSGDTEKIKEFWSTVATVGDGEGNIKATGSQGRRGYEGDYMFAFQGATTPLGPVAWNAMGTIGGRVLFHEAVGDYNEESIRRARWEKETEPAVRKQEAQEVVSEFLRTIWHERADGYGSVEWQARDGWKPSKEVQKAIVKFAHLVAIARTPMNLDDDGEWQAQTPEVYHRLRDQFINLARSRAQMHGRERIEMDDLDLIARVALSTMPEKRRPYVRWLMDPETATGCKPGKGKAWLSDVVDYVPHSRDTVLSHLKLLDRLDLLTLDDVGDGDESKWLVNKKASGDQVWSPGEHTRFDNIWELGVPFPARYFVERDD